MPNNSSDIMIDFVRAAAILIIGFIVIKGLMEVAINS
jgi:hypothetical protein